MRPLRRRRSRSTRHNRAGPTALGSKNPAHSRRARRAHIVRAVAMGTIVDRIADQMVIAVIVQTTISHTVKIIGTVAVNRTMVTATAAAMVAAIIAGVVMAGPARAMMAGAAMTTMVAADTHAAVVSLALTADVTPHIAAGDGHRAVTQALSSLSGLSAIAAGHAIIPFQLQSLSYRHMVAGRLAPHIP